MNRSRRVRELKEGIAGCRDRIWNSTQAWKRSMGYHREMGSGVESLIPVAALTRIYREGPQIPRCLAVLVIELMECASDAI